jgi:hypothetical protein
MRRPPAFLALDGIAAAGALGVRDVVVGGLILGAWRIGPMVLDSVSQDRQLLVRRNRRQHCRCG